MTGIYIHIPFCKSKCPYCDFYSFKADEQTKDSYLKAVLSCLESYSEMISDTIDTVYFGGGTPSCFGGERIKEVIDCIRNKYTVTDGAEIAVECSPSSVDEELVRYLYKAGVNRISMGMQSAVDRERLALGRVSDKATVKSSVELFKKYGLDNISLDLMLGIPHQTKESLKESIDFITSLSIKHISAYMLKIEEGTPFHIFESSLSLPDEDEICDLYLYACELIKSHNYKHYEISNFALEGYESRHNLRYWRCEEYLGIGPSAHSFIGGKRFYYERDFNKFLHSPSPVYDGEGGDEQEYIMLSLRLAEGLQKEKYKARFNKDLGENIIKKARFLEKQGLIQTDESSIHLTTKGFLVSNSVISYLFD